MRSNPTSFFVLLAVFLLTACVQQAWSSEATSEPFTYLEPNTAAPFSAIDEFSFFTEKQQLSQSIKALETTYLATALLKHVIGAKRPNSDAEDSFPSGHTSLAFAMATVVADYRPDYKWPAYITACAVGYSRVESGAHYWGDVVGGALLGHYVAKHFTKGHVAAAPDGVALQWNW